MDHENKRKGGRIPAKNFKFYGQDAVRSSNTRLAKAKFGSLAVDCIQCAHERMAQSDFALFMLNEKNLKQIELEDQITHEEFLNVMKYCTYELRMFDEVLLKNNILFSVEFVRTFDLAGLFRHRTYGLADILRVANHYRPGHPPLTAEDELEIIAQGRIPPIDVKWIPSSNNAAADPKLKPIVKENHQQPAEQDEDNLPF
jgi:hypothetical protein